MKDNETTVKPRNVSIIHSENAHNPKHLYIKENFPIGNNGNSDDSSHNQKYSYKLINRKCKVKIHITN